MHTAEVHYVTVAVARVERTWEGCADDGEPGRGGSCDETQMTKITAEHYRAAARRLYYQQDLTVNPFATVQLSFEDGAFVDLTVWVPAVEAMREAELDSREMESKRS